MATCISNECVSYEAPIGAGTYTQFPAGPNSSVIYDQTINSLTSSINTERARRGLAAYTFRTIAGSDPEDGVLPSDAQGIIYGQDAPDPGSIQQMKDAINQIRVNSVTFLISDGPITYSQINNIKTVIDGLRNECICNTDCGANIYCTCDTYCSRCAY
jgi:hypothetical protein